MKACYWSTAYFHVDCLQKYIAFIVSFLFSCLNFNSWTSEIKHVKGNCVLCCRCWLSLRIINMRKQTVSFYFTNCPDLECNDTVFAPEKWTSCYTCVVYMLNSTLTSSRCKNIARFRWLNSDESAALSSHSLFNCVAGSDAKSPEIRAVSPLLQPCVAHSLISLLFSEYLCRTEQSRVRDVWTRRSDHLAEPLPVLG